MTQNERLLKEAIQKSEDFLNNSCSAMHMWHKESMRLIPLVVEERLAAPRSSLAAFI